MTLLPNLIGFLIFFFIFAYLPGLLSLHALKIKSSWDLKLATGIFILGSSLFFGRWLLANNQVLSLLFLITLIYSALKFKSLNFKLKKTKPNYKLLLVLFLGTTAQSLPYILSLLKGEPHISYDIFSSHDQAWHASLIYELTNHFPPQIPGFSGLVLKNYHYLYDLILAANLKIFNQSLPYLLQGIYPVAISLFFGISIYRATSLLTKNNLTPTLAVFFGYFANNLSFLQQFFGKNDWQISDFIIDQPIIYLFNHQTVLSISLVIYLLILISKTSQKKLDIKKALLISIGLSSLILLKIYAFLVILSALSIYWILNIKNQKNLFFTLSLTGLLSLLYLGLAFKLGGKFINFNPGWIAEAFFDKTLAPLFPKLHGLQMIWQQQGNNLKLSILKVLSLALLLLSSFHLRLIGLLQFNKKITPLHKLLLLTSLTSILLTLTGNQSSSAYNIVQFAPYAVIITTILFLKIVNEFPVTTRNMYIYLFFSISILGSYKPVIGMANFNPPIIDKDKINLLENLNNKTEGVLISFIEDQERSILFNDKIYYAKDFGNNTLSSVSQKRSFYADQKQLIVLGLNYQDRLKIIDQLNNHFCEFTTQDKQVINQYNLKYFLTKNNQPCNDSSLTLIKNINNLNLYEYQK